MQNNHQGKKFVITHQEGSQFAKLQTDDFLERNYLQAIEANGGKQCNVWLIPEVNVGGLFSDLNRINPKPWITSQPGIIDIGVAQNRVHIGRIPENDQFTFDLDELEFYVTVRSKQRRYYEEDEMIYKIHGGIQQNGIRKIPISFYKSCMEKLKLRHRKDEIIETLRLQELMQNHYVTHPMKKVKRGQISCFSIKKSVSEKLYNHQRTCVEKGVRLNGRILIADDIGMGKSYSALALASLYRHNFPLLIVCKKDLGEQWAEETTLRLGIPRNVINVGQKISTHQVNIITYEQSDIWPELLKNQKICIVDETGTFRKAKNTNGFSVIQKCENKIFLSGTPFLTQPLELFDQLKLLQKYGLGGLAYIQNENEEDLSELLDPANYRDFHEYFKQYTIARTSKKQVMGKLIPECNRYKISIPLKNDFNNQGNQLKNFKQIGIDKIECILRIVRKLLEDGEKILFFAYHQEINEKVEEMCTGMNVKSLRLDGTVEVQQRIENIKLFQKEDYRIAIISFLIGSYGFNLQSASSVVFGEMYFSDSSIMVQAEGRAHRLGQKQIVDCYYLVGNCQQDEERFEKIQENFSEFQENISQEQEIFGEIDMSFDQFFKAARHQTKQKQTKKVITEEQLSRMTTRSQTLQKKAEKAFNKYKKDNPNKKQKEEVHQIIQTKNSYDPLINAKKLKNDKLLRKKQDLLLKQYI